MQPRYRPARRPRALLTRAVPSESRSGADGSALLHRPPPSARPDAPRAGVGGGTHRGAVRPAGSRDVRRAAASAEGPESGPGRPAPAGPRVLPQDPAGLSEAQRQRVRGEEEFEDAGKRPGAETCPRWDGNAFPRIRGGPWSTLRSRKIPEAQRTKPRVQNQSQGSLPFVFQKYEPRLPNSPFPTGLSGPSKSHRTVFSLMTT